MLNCVSPQEKEAEFARIMEAERKRQEEIQKQQEELRRQTEALQREREQMEREKEELERQRQLEMQVWSVDGLPSCCSLFAFCVFRQNCDSKVLSGTLKNKAFKAFLADCIQWALPVHMPFDWGGGAGKLIFISDFLIPNMELVIRILLYSCLYRTVIYSKSFQQQDSAVLLAASWKTVRTDLIHLPYIEWSFWTDQIRQRFFLLTTVRASHKAQSVVRKKMHHYTMSFPSCIDLFSLKAKTLQTCSLHVISHKLAKAVVCWSLQLATQL